MKKKIIVFVLIFSIVFTVGCTSGKTIDNTDVKIVVDCANREVKVPLTIEKISCVCPFTGAMIVMFGYGEKITSGANNMIRSVLLNNICPGIADVPSVKSNGSINAETLLEYGADIIFVNLEHYESDDQRAKLDALNIPYVVIDYTDIEGQLNAVKVIGEVLGTEDEAESYINWYRNTIERVKSGCDSIEGKENIRLYHSVNEATRTDYEGSICAEWIAYTGVCNVSVNDESLKLEGDKAYTTLETIYNWNPDIIICNEAGVDDYILTDSKWSGLDAVVNERVYQIPVGTSRMGHPTSTETPLALLWLAELLYPDNFDIDMNYEIKSFYKTFYNYEVSDELAEAIINADDMRTEKQNQGLE